MGFYIFVPAGLVLAAFVSIALIYQAVGSARDARRFAPPGRLVDIHNGDGGRARRAAPLRTVRSRTDAPARTRRQNPERR